MRNYLAWAKLVEFEYWPVWLKALTFVAILFISFASCVESF